jgi:hypothetical protein
MSKSTRLSAAAKKIRQLHKEVLAGRRENQTQQKGGVAMRKAAPRAATSGAIRSRKTSEYCSASLALSIPLSLSSNQLSQKDRTQTQT